MATWRHLSTREQILVMALLGLALGLIGWFALPYREAQ
jgi:hypothetical protein